MNLWLKLYKKFPRYKESKTVRVRVVKDHLIITDQDLEIFRKSAEVKDNTQPISIRQLGKDYHINDTMMIKKISRVMAELEHLFGPIPETVLEEIKKKCSY